MISDWTRNIYLREVAYQVECAGYAHGVFVEALKEGDIRASFTFSQNILAAAANVSKLLWASPPKEKPEWLEVKDADYEEFRTYVLRRAKKLRRVLKVSDDSILKSRRVRNALEHFDDRLDAHTFLGKPIVDMNWGPLHKMPFGRDDVLRNLDPATGILSVLSEAVPLGEVFQELDRIHALASGLLAGELPTPADAPQQAQK